MSHANYPVSTESNSGRDFSGGSVSDVPFETLANRSFLQEVPSAPEWNSSASMMNSNSDSQANLRQQIGGGGGEVKLGVPQQKRNNLYVSLLPKHFTNQDLYRLFSPFGVIENSTVARDSQSGLCKGYGFVQFAQEHEAAHAMMRMNGTLCHGRTLHVKLADPRANPPPPQQQSNKPKPMVTTPMPVNVAPASPSAWSSPYYPQPQEGGSNDYATYYSSVTDAYQQCPPTYPAPPNIATTSVFPTSSSFPATSAPGRYPHPPQFFHASPMQSPYVTVNQPWTGHLSYDTVGSPNGHGLPHLAQGVMQPQASAGGTVPTYGSPGIVSPGIVSTSSQSGDPTHTSPPQLVSSELNNTNQSEVRYVRVRTKSASGYTCTGIL